MSAQENTRPKGAGLDVSKSEHGVIRVFSISRPMASMALALKQQPKAALATTLLGHPVDIADIELFAVSDLAGVGLPAYLTEGYDVDHSVVRADLARLEALDGYVLLVFSTVAKDGDVTLAPAAELTLIGTYSEPKRDLSTQPLMAQAAKPYSGTAQPAQAPRRARVGSVMTGLCVLAIVILIWWTLS